MSTTANRRDFVRALAATTGACLAPAVAKSDEPKTEPRKPEPPKTDRSTKDAVGSAEVDARTALVVARFGKHLDDEARKTIRKEIEDLVRRSQTLRDFPLENGDGPFPVFTPFRAAPG